MKTLIMAIAALSLSGCLDSGGGSSAPSAVPSLADTTQPVAPTPDPSAVVQPITTQPVVAAPVVDTGAPTNFTYYSRTLISNPQNLVTKQFSNTGYCGVYLSKTYCWDDGIHTILAWNGWPEDATYTYWGLRIKATDVTTYSICYGGCVSDWMKTPRDLAINNVGVNIANNFGSTGHTVSDVFSHGVRNIVDCNELNGVLTCGSLVIQLNQ